MDKIIAPDIATAKIRAIVRATGTFKTLKSVTLDTASRSKQQVLDLNGTTTYVFIEVPIESPIDPVLEQEFNTLADRWHKETRLTSSVSKMAMHPAYQGIIALGRSVIPLILRDLQKTRDHWLWALYVLNRFHDPAPSDASFDEAVDAWLTWGKEQGYLE